MNNNHRKTKCPPKIASGGIYGTCGNPVLRGGQVFDALNLEKQTLFGTLSLSHLDGVPPNLYCCRILDVSGKTDKIKYRNRERKQRERPFEKSACAHLIMPTNVHLHVLRVAGFSAFVFYKRKIRNRETNTTGNDQREEKP